MKETFQSTVKNRINGDMNHGWGIDDSMAVILALIKKETGKELTEECQAMVKSVINPSAARQAFAKQGLLAKETSKERIVKEFMKFNAD